jgi:DHA1 family quinolone resistance protein-like MFS transporter
MFSDIFVLTGFGLISPILAIFIKDDIVGGSIFAAGLASTLFLITKSIVQLPFSKYVDSHDDKIKWLIMGTFLISVVPIIYMFSNNINTIYLAQILYGIGGGLAYPTWLGLWSTHLDKKHESFEWSLYSTSVGIGVAATASIGAAIANFFSFNFTFLLVWFMSIAGCFVLFWLEKKDGELEKVKIEHYHRKRKISHRE